MGYRIEGMKKEVKASLVCSWRRVIFRNYKVNKGNVVLPGAKEESRTGEGTYPPERRMPRGKIFSMGKIRNSQPWRHAESHLLRIEQKRRWVEGI